MSAVRTADGAKTIVGLAYRDAEGALQELGAGFVRTADNVLKAFFSSMSATATPDAVEGFANNPATVAVITQSVVSEPVGGAPPYTVLWTRTDGGEGEWNISHPTASITEFGTNVDPGGTASATFIATYTDASGATAASNEVYATCRNLGGGLILGTD